MIELSKIVEASERVKEIIQPTPLALAPNLSEMCGCSIFLKKENLQHTGAYKLRGAFNKISILMQRGEIDISAGVIAASAGNHAQGVAYSARYFNMPAVIVMPEATPLTKILGVKRYGGEVVLVGNNYDEACAHALKLSKERNMQFIHPFADEDVMAGQGTVALEILNEMPDINKILVPIGGGGLISGVASAYRQIKPNVEIIGVTSKGAPALFDSFKGGRVIDSKSVKTIADGIAVRDTNPKNLENILELVDDIVQVDDEEIANAILFLLERQKIVVEGAGATGVAALMHEKIKIDKGDKIGAILTGGNIDVTMLNLIIEKGLLKSYRKMHLIVTLVDKPGSLRSLTDVLSDCGANIVKIDYDRTSTALDYGDAHVTIATETRGVEHQNSIREKLKANGFRFQEYN